MEQIISNLLENAIRYTETGKVLVGVRRVGRCARIEVHDTGRGIAKEDQQSIFQEFKRIDDSHAEAGLGLGLAIVEQACRSLDHPLRLWSEPGRGSCFSFDVPIQHTSASSASQMASLKTAPADIRDGLVVLLVENDPKLADAMTFLIEGWGAHVIHAENGENALQLLAEIELTPDAALLDYQLGNGMSGVSLYSRIKRLYGDVPAWIVSADRGPEIQRDCQKHGLELFSKPIDQQRLLAFLSAIDQSPDRGHLR